MKKIAIFLGDFFLSSIPYDGIRLYELLSQSIGADFLMFDKDIRLNKIFSGNEKYKFDVNIFKNIPNLKLLNSWDELITISKDYELIIASVHIAPKNRYPENIKSKIKCQFAAWDIGGADILNNAIHFAHKFFVKGPIWKTWLVNRGIKEKNIYITGSPHYDDYHIRDFNKELFYKKYKINLYSKTILVCPSNQLSHTLQFKENILELEKLFSIAEIKNFKILIKTYPSDYLFYEKEFNYSGVYARKYGDMPQYEFLKHKFPNSIIIESQDHFDAMINCDAVFNMSGSSISWETHFSKSKSYSMNYKNKPYYETVSYLKNIKFPDSIYNENIENINDIDFECKEKHSNNEYITTLDACEEIKNRIIEMIYK